MYNILLICFYTFKFLQHVAIDIPVLLLYMCCVFAVIVVPCVTQISRHINSPGVRFDHSKLSQERKRGLTSDLNLKNIVIDNNFDALCKGNL